MNHPTFSLDCPLTHTWNDALQRCDIMWNSIHTVEYIVYILLGIPGIFIAYKFYKAIKRK